MTSIEIPNSVETIGDYAFAACSNLTNITIPNSVTSIGDHVFNNCSSLEAIDVEDGNKKYCSEDGVLFNFDKTSLIRCPAGKKGHYDIPNSVIKIGTAGFYNCYDLNTVTIPNSVTHIGEYGFYGCHYLTSIEIPSSLTAIDNYGFCNCQSLTSIEIPNSVTFIGNNAFAACGCLQSIEIPNSITAINERTFEYCFALTSVKISSSVTYIGDQAFNNCVSIKSVEYAATEPCAANDNIFTDVVYQEATLYYPIGYKSKYEITSPWNKFTKTEEKDFAGINEVASDNKMIDGAPERYFLINGVEVSDASAPGLYIIRQGDKVRKMIRN